MRFFRCQYRMKSNESIREDVLWLRQIPINTNRFMALRNYFLFFFRFFSHFDRINSIMQTICLANQSRKNFNFFVFAISQFNKTDSRSDLFAICQTSNCESSAYLTYGNICPVSKITNYNILFLRMGNCGLKLSPISIRIPHFYPIFTILVGSF